MEALDDEMHDTDSNDFLWVIPLTAYNAVEEGLSKNGTVERRISEKDLEFAKFAREREKKNIYDSIPSANAEELKDVPAGLRNQLTTWQRQGVAFCIQRKGTCMIGDEVCPGIDFEEPHTSHVNPQNSQLTFLFFFLYNVADGARENYSSNCIHVCIRR